ncbi:hypothetical protein ACIRBX_25180 [Kitasatospora sp. NPDC096147]|uniref:hypothetical protein n=1 Tax=Kitasatospora sp. NPDC096147 TaxID=3364093 RepID=UPI0038208757
MPAMQPSAIGAGFAAFVQLHQPVYEKYARARLGDQDLGHRAVALAFRRTELGWNALLSDPRPLACAWRILRDSVTFVRPEDTALDVDALHRELPAPAADASVLRLDLGLQPARVAEVMGVPEPELHVAVMAARRQLEGGEEVIIPPRP